jgi:23S rRNA (cytosine1962-C5)-methyltransferase
LRNNKRKNPEVRIANNWNDYKLIDTGGGEKLESWGGYTVVRPDPQIIWKTDNDLRKNADAYYIRSDKGGGRWEFRSGKAPVPFKVGYNAPCGELRFIIKPTDFKHMGLFPEQAVNWDFIQNSIVSRIKNTENQPNNNAETAPNILNLFAYTGGATLAAAATGAKVCHVDASKGITAWAKENAAASGLVGKPIRYIVDDCEKFIRREIRRGVRYDGIIMDPPSYGRGASGEVWKLEDNLWGFVKLAAEVLSDTPLFFILNSYTTGLAPEVMNNILTLTVKSTFGGSVSGETLGLPTQKSEIILPCGSSSIWTV